jgi:outer membrane immunogenic protein
MFRRQQPQEELPMRRLLLVGVVLGALATPAASADIAPYFAAVPAPIWGWTGFYVGGNAGGVFSTGNAVTNIGSDTDGAGLGAFLSTGAIPASVTLSQIGFIGGGQMGYNWQIGPEWVWGVEADLAGTTAKSSTSTSFGGNAVFVPLSTTYSRELDVLGTVRGRAGYLLLSSVLLYGTAGLAYAQTRFESSFLCAACTPPSGTQGNTANQPTYNSVGWTAGAGVEWQFTPAWSIKAEYLFVDLGKASTSTISYSYSPNTSSLTSTLNERENVVRLGFNYRFY